MASRPRRTPETANKKPKVGGDILAQKESLMQDVLEKARNGWENLTTLLKGEAKEGEKRKAQGALVAVGLYFLGLFSKKPENENGDEDTDDEDKITGDTDTDDVENEDEKGEAESAKQRGDTEVKQDEKHDVDQKKPKQLGKIKIKILAPPAGFASEEWTEAMWGGKWNYDLRKDPVAVRIANSSMGLGEKISKIAYRAGRMGNLMVYVDESGARWIIIERKRQNGRTVVMARNVEGKQRQLSSREYGKAKRSRFPNCWEYVADAYKLAKASRGSAKYSYRDTIYDQFLLRKREELAGEGGLLEGEYKKRLKEIKKGRKVGKVYKRTPEEVAFEGALNAIPREQRDNLIQIEFSALDIFATKEEIKKYVRPGSHITYFNDNDTDIRGLHSELVVAFNPDTGKVTTLSHWAGKKKLTREKKFNLYEKKVATIYVPKNTGE